LYSRNPETPKSRSAGHFSQFRELLCVDVGFVLAKSRTPKSRSASHFSQFQRLCDDVGLYSQNSELRNPKVLVHLKTCDAWAEPQNPEVLVHLSTFHISEVEHVRLGCLHSRSPEPRNPEVLGPTFAIREMLCFDVLAFEVAGFRTPKPRSTEATVFQFFFFFAFLANNVAPLFLCVRHWKIVETHLSTVFHKNCRNRVGIIGYMNNSNMVRNGLVESMENFHPR
jgi:hypothetical protein